MSSPPDNPRLLMVRNHLDGIPAWEVPQGVAVRWYRRGDEAAWLRIQQGSDFHNRFTPETFDREFGPNFGELAERQCYLVRSDGEAVGTVTAWHNDRIEGEGWARLHWMAVLPNYQLRGLGKALMSSICERMRVLGCHRAYLSTGQARLPAIGLYLAFGFVPLIRNEQDSACWAKVSTSLAGPRVKSGL